MTTVTLSRPALAGRGDETIVVALDIEDHALGRYDARAARGYSFASPNGGQCFTR
jgi:hypothetical protein